MKVYIASSFSLLDRIERMLSQLRIMDIQYTVDWWNRKTLKRIFMGLSKEDFYMREECIYAFKTDLQGIKDCDALIFIADEIPRKYNGGAVEIGIAIALNKPIVCWGRLENSAMFYPIQQFDSLKDVVNWLYIFKEKI